MKEKICARQVTTSDPSRPSPPSARVKARVWADAAEIRSRGVVSSIRNINTSSGNRNHVIYYDYARKTPKDGLRPSTLVY